MNGDEFREMKSLRMQVTQLRGDLRKMRERAEMAEAERAEAREEAMRMHAWFKGEQSDQEKDV